MRLICLIVSIAPTHCKQECFALLHSHHLFSVHLIWRFCLSETLWISRLIFSFTLSGYWPSIFSFPFHPFLYMFFFPLYVRCLKFPIFYLSKLCSSYLFFLASIFCTLHCPFWVLSQILTVLRMYFPSFSLQRSFPSPFLSSTLGDTHLFSSTERQDRTKVKGLPKLTGYCLEPLLSSFFNWSIIQRYWVLPIERKINAIKLRQKSPFALRP